MMLPSQAHLDPRFKPFPNLPEDRFRVDPRRADPRARQARGRAQRAHDRAARVHAGRDRVCCVAIAAQVAQIDPARAALRGSAAPRRRAGGARAISEAVSTRSTSRSRSRRSCARRWTRVGATGAALVLDDGDIAWPEGRPGAYAVRLPLRWSGVRSASSSATATRRSPTTTAQLLVSIAHHAAVALEHGRAVMRGVLAQEIHHRVKNNLQTVASLLRLQARATDGVDPREALEHSVNRILAIAAVHEVLTERRDDDVRARRPARPAPRDARSGDRRRQGSRAVARAGLARGHARDRARARLQRASAERARARRRGRAASSSRSGTATSSSRSPTPARASRARATEQASRSCARSCATSCRDGWL